MEAQCLPVCVGRAPIDGGFRGGRAPPAWGVQGGAGGAEPPPAVGRMGLNTAFRRSAWGEGRLVELPLAASLLAAITAVSECPMGGCLVYRKAIGPWNSGLQPHLVTSCFTPVSTLVRQTPSLPWAACGKAWARLTNKGLATNTFCALGNPANWVKQFSDFWHCNISIDFTSSWPRNDVV